MSSIIQCSKLPDLSGSYIAVIDGKAATTGSTFLRCIGEQLKFPGTQNGSWDAYLDWMRDLSWIGEKSISIVIVNYEDFLSEEPDSLKYFQSDLEGVVFPFWRNDAKEVFESQQEIKNVTVYCMNGSLLETGQASTKAVATSIRQNALDGQKTPHSTSQPVLRLHDGKLCIAAFVFFYSREQFKSFKVNRPSMWVVCDLNTGEIIGRYNCSEREFSDGDYQRFYDVSQKNVLPATKDNLDFAYVVMDLIRYEYAVTGAVNKEIYKTYLDLIYDMTPQDYRVFYRDLSSIEQ